MQIVDSLVPTTARPLHEEPAPVTPPASRVPVAFESAPFDQSRWDAWVTKNRLADTAFAEKTRMLAMLGVMAAVATGTVWFFLG